jgi:hypothetical protein
MAVGNAVSVYTGMRIAVFLGDTLASPPPSPKPVLSWGKTPDQVVAERLRAKRTLAKGKSQNPQGRAGPCDTTKTRLIAECAKQVSQPESYSETTTWPFICGCSPQM